MLKKIFEFNRRLTKPLIAINCILLGMDFVGMYLADTQDLKKSFLKYIAIHGLILVLLVVTLETKSSKK